MIGVDIRKENRAASSLVRLKKRAVVIVLPERDTPGIIDKACERPIQIASFNVIECIVRISRFLSAKYPCEARRQMLNLDLPIQKATGLVQDVLNWKNGQKFPQSLDNT